MEIKKAASRQPVIVHDDIYRNWVLQENGPTQGRRFTNAFELIKQAYPDIKVLDTRPATGDELGLVHDSAYIERVLMEHSCEQWIGKREDLSLLARLLAGGTINALYALLDGQSTTAIHLPGAKHHAQFDHSSGFCVFADFAIAAKLATNLGLRVAIFDFDAHHGDGTENLTTDNPDVLTFSVHEKNIFPYTGNEDDPERHIYNEALPAESDGADLANATSRFITLAREFKPDLIFIAGGADGNELDTLSHLRYTTTDAHFAMSMIRNSYPDMPVLFGGAGGYRPDDMTPKMWLASIQGLVGEVTVG